MRQNRGGELFSVEFVPANSYLWCVTIESGGDP
jgi:hypothetical protein